VVADQHNFIMPLPMTRNGQDGILVIVDRLSKMTHFAPTTSDVDGVATARLFMDYVFKRHGLPERVVTDRGTQFRGQFFAELARLLGTKQDLSSAYHPQTDGQTERMNRVLEEMLRHYVNPTQKAGAAQDRPSYKLELPPNMRIHDVFHVSLLKPYRSDGEERPPPPALFIDGVPEYEVEAILAHRQRRYGKGKMKFRYEYFVQWKGYPAEHNSWEPGRNLTHCDETLREYWGRAGLAIPPDEDQPDAAADSRTAADNRNTPIL